MVTEVESFLTEVESFRTASLHVSEGYATPRGKSPNDSTYIVFLHHHLTLAHTCLQRAKLLVDEYEREYENAVVYAGIQVWASMHRRNGDPRWEWQGCVEQGCVERCT